MVVRDVAVLIVGSVLGAKQLAVSLWPEKVLVHGNLRRKGSVLARAGPSLMTRTKKTKV